jgi:hypothetical protein
MKAAGASMKDVKTASLAFKRQESLFQERLNNLRGSVSEDQQRMVILRQKAKKELQQVCASLPWCSLYV